MRLGKLTRHRVVVATSAVLVAAGILLSPTATAAPLPYGPDTCEQGWVWREASPSDLVCVLPGHRSQAKYDNSQAATRRNPTGPYGPNTCVQGYVWREAFAGDVVCVTPQTRDLAAYDNGEDANRKAMQFIHVHVVVLADDDGQRRAGITPQQFQQWINYTGGVYGTAKVRVMFDPNPSGPDWSTMNSTLLNTMTGDSHPDWAEQRAAGNRLAVEHPGKVVAIVRYGPTGSSATGVGFSWTDYNFVVLPGFDATTVCNHQNITVFAHELGHYLDLRHTFAKEFRTKNDASNDLAASPDISFDGDGLTDTPPDPFVRGTTGIECTSDPSITLNGKEGAIAFLVPRDNIMSYYDYLPLYKKLTPQQAKKVRRWIDHRAL